MQKEISFIRKVVKYSGRLVVSIPPELYPLVKKGDYFIVKLEKINGQIRTEEV